MKLRQKLLLGFLGNSMLLGFITAVSISTNLHNEYYVTQVSESSVKEFEAATQMNRALEASHIAVHKLMLKKYNTIVSKKRGNSKQQFKELEIIKSELNKFTEFLTYSKNATNFAMLSAQESGFLEEVEQEQNELKMLNKLDAEFSVHKKLIEQYLFIIDSDVEKSEQFLHDTLEPNFQKKVLPLIQEYESDAKVELNSQSIRILEDIYSARQIISGVSIVAIATAIFSGLFISYSIVKPINKVKEAAIKIGKGKLNTKVNIKSRDEIGILANTFNQMSERLNTTTVLKSYVDNIIKSMLDILIVTDLNGIITRVNQATLNLLGYKESELLGEHIEVIFAKKDIFNLVNLAYLRQKGFLENIETTYLTKDSSKITVSFSASVIHDNNGEVQGIVCVAQNITERKRAEEANARLAIAIEYAADAIEITDTEARFEYVNPAFEKITGYTRAEVMGKTSASLLRSGKHDAAFYQKMSNTISRGKVWSGCYIGKRKDGSLYHQEVTISPVCNSEGEIIHHVAVKRDITERNRLKERLVKINECFLSFGTDPSENINRLTAVCGELLGATSTLYSRIEKGMLCSAGKWQIPEGYNSVDTPDSSICYEVIQQGSNEPFVVSDLPSTTYAQTDFNVMFYGWKTYIGQAVRCKDICIGSLCAIYEKNYIPSDTDKTVIGIIAAAIGVEEERRWTQEALSESKERYRAVVEQASEGIFIVDADSKRLLETNPAFQNLLGYTCEEILGLTLYDVIAHDHESINSNFQSILAEKSRRIGERQYRRKDSSLVDVEVNVNFIFYEGREVLCVIVRDITERKLTEKQLLHNALYDALTGLPNRVLFMDRLGHAINRAKRGKDYLFAVLFLDLDRFKVVNDSLGHMIGDQLLIAIAHRLQVCLRSGDTFARLGGDEFTILVENIKNVEDAKRVADRIHKELTLPFNLNGYEVFTAASIGIALNTVGYDQPEDLLRDADTAMYRAKAGGKARSEVFDLTMHTQAMALLELETDLKRSLKQQEFQLYYQPIVSLKTGLITGFEALVRWHHPLRGIISPAEFILLAEETGLIVPLGYWVLHEACRQMKTWQVQFPEKASLTISVNISGRQFLQSDLVAQICQILHETGLEPLSLGLEITESAIMKNTEAAALMLLQLRDLGIRLYMDDFGTGYSSLSYLHRFPFNTLKIDRSFINNIDIDAEKIEIIHTVVTLAAKLGMDVVAEGVETNKQMYQLKALKCEFGQGYFFSKPLNSGMAEALIADEPQRICSLGLCDYFCQDLRSCF
jgi:diguanylate cyclase (GGDEF)-like protein/PAS domain S-box-containing protein